MKYSINIAGLYLWELSCTILILTYDKSTELCSSQQVFYSGSAYLHPIIVWFASIDLNYIIYLIILFYVIPIDLVLVYSSSAFSLPTILLWPGTQQRLILICSCSLTKKMFSYMGNFCFIKVSKFEIVFRCQNCCIFWTG